MWREFLEAATDSTLFQGRCSVIVYREEKSPTRVALRQFHGALAQDPEMERVSTQYPEDSKSLRAPPPAKLLPAAR